MTPIRILQVFTVMNRGGAETMIMNYYRKIDKTKIQFDFLVHRNEKADYDDEIEALGGKIYRFTPVNIFYPKLYYNSLRTFFMSHNNYVIIHSHLNTFSCFPLKIAAEFNIPCRIAHAHIALSKVDFLSVMYGKEKIKDTLKKVVKLRLKKKIKKDATHLFSCGDKAGQWLFGDSPFKTMNNAIDTEKFKFCQSVSETYKKDFGVEEELVLGHIGRFVSQKNHVYLIKIFASLLKKHKKATLVLIGDGPLKKSIEMEAKNLKIDHKVKFLGIREDIPQLCQMMDVFVFPSLYEGLPVTLIEAQAASMKIMASDNITKEVKLTDNIEFISIEEDMINTWANKIINLNILNRLDQTSAIINGNYDIVSNTKDIQDFYLSEVNK